MKKITSYLLMIFIAGCFYKKNLINHDITINCIDYIKFIKETQAISKNRPFMLNVKEVSSKNGDYFAYRISSQQPYLPLRIIPSEFNYISGYPVIYFLNEDLASKKEVIDKIKKAGIYNDEMAYRFRTNYPEWVMLYKRNSNSYKLIKGARYRDLEELIKLN